MNFRKLLRRFAQPSSLGGLSSLSILGILIPELLGQGDVIGPAVSAGIESGVSAGRQAAASGANAVTAAILGAVAGVTGALAIVRSDKSDE